MIRLYEHKTFAYVAIAIAIINIIMTFIVVIPSVAITSEGFVTWQEISPPNTVLFSGRVTGVVSNPQGYNIVACAYFNHNGDFRGTLFASTSQFLGVTIENVNGQSTVSSLEAITYNGSTIYVCADYSDRSTTGNNYPYAEFNGLANPTNSIATDFYNYVINNTSGGNDEVNNSLNYSLPAGNLAIITTTASYNYLKLTTTMPLQSTVFSGNPWPNTTQRIGTYNTLPQSLNASTLGNVIEWQKTGDTTLFGNTHSALYEPSVVSKFTYIVISNPYYYPANNMEDSQFTNGAINIQMDDVVSIEVRNLTASVNTSTGEIENNQNGTSWTGEIDDETGDITWTDNNGDKTIPDGGGNLSDPTITGFQSWLKGILTSIRDIFAPAHDAIQTLSGAVRNFANWMYALYIWLPSPILNILTSAISLAIVIGVIKVFI